MINFQKPGYKLNWKWNIRLKGYRLHLSDQIKYLEIFLDRFLNCYCQSNLLMQKLARAVGILSQVRYYFHEIELKNIYHAIFEVHLRYGCQIWFHLTLNLLETKFKTSKRKSYESCHFQNYKSHPHPCLRNGKYLKSEVL